MGYIYLITNQLNGKQYVGLTTRTLEARWSEHLQKAKYESSGLHGAMKKYGIQNFLMTKLEECDDSCIGEREQYWIQKMNTYENGYNLTRGGNGGRTSIDREEIFKLWNDNNTIRNIAKITGHNTDAISKILQEEYNISQSEILSKGYKERNNHYKSVNQYTLNREFVASYKSMSEAQKKTGIAYTHIGQCCNKKRLTAGGYFWEYNLEEIK